MADKLLPCPFCGGKAVYRSGGDYYSPHGWNAGCEDGHSGSPDMPTKAKAREWWNRRAALASHTSALAEKDEEIARLREALKPFADRYDAWGHAAKTAYSSEDYSSRLLVDLARARSALTGQQKG